MKRSLIAALLGVLSATGTVRADDGVEIYGRLGASVERQKNLRTPGWIWVLEDSGSRIGFRAREDLGEGRWVSFALEWGAPIGTLLTVRSAGTRTTAMTLGGPAGVLRVGTYPSEAYLATSRETDRLNDGYGSSLDLMYRYIGANRPRVGYRTPPLFGGVTAEVGLSVNDETSPREFDVAVRGNHGAWDFGLGLEHVAGREQQQALRVSWEAGRLRLAGYLQNYRWTAADADQRTARIAAVYRQGSVEWHGALGWRGPLGDIAGTRGEQQTLGANLWLSRHTKLFAFWNRVQIVAFPATVSVGLGLREEF